MTQREFDLEEDYRKTIKKLENGEPYKIQRIRRPMDD